MRAKLTQLFKTAVRRVLGTSGERKLKNLLNETKKKNKSLQWFWRRIDKVADWMIDIAVSEILDDLASEIVEHNPGVSYSDAKAYVKREYRSAIKGVIKGAVTSSFQDLKDEYDDCSAREAAQGCVDNWDGIFAEVKEAAEEAARRTYETWSGEYEDWS